jgi:hypothetical protein
MHRRALLLLSVTAACQPKKMDLDFYYAFSDGTPRTHTQLTIQGTLATLIRQSAGRAGHPIGVWQTTLDAASIEALAAALPKAPPPGPPLAPGMPNHLFRLRQGGPERMLRLAHEPEILEQVQPFIRTLEKTIASVAAHPYRTLAIQCADWAPAGLVIELTAAGSQPVTIPNAAEAIEVRTANRAVAAKAPAGPLRVEPGKPQRLTIPFRREPGQPYQVFYHRTGAATLEATDIFGDANSALAPQ